MEKKAEAKKTMLSSLSKEMRDMMGEGLSGALKDKMMKVTVAGDDPKSVEKGLDKAKEILKKKMGDSYQEEDEDMEENDRSPAEIEDLDEAEEMSESKEELEEKIEELKKKLSELKE